MGWMWGWSARNWGMCWVGVVSWWGIYRVTVGACRKCRRFQVAGIVGGRWLGLVGLWNLRICSTGWDLELSLAENTRNSKSQELSAIEIGVIMTLEIEVLLCRVWIPRSPLHFTYIKHEVYTVEITTSAAVGVAFHFYIFSATLIRNKLHKHLQ